MEDQRKRAVYTGLLSSMATGRVAGAGLRSEMSWRNLEIPRVLRSTNSEYPITNTINDCIKSYSAQNR